MRDLDVLAIGSALVELTPTEPGSSLVAADTYRALPSGAAANFCVALAKLGAKVALASRVGDDELGEWLRQRLQGFGVDTSLVRGVPGQRTPVSFCWMDQDGAKTFYFYRFPEHCDPMREFAAEPLTDGELARAQVFDFSEATIRSEPLRSVTLDLARRARGLGVQVVYAVNYRPSSWREPHEQIVAVQREALSLAEIALMNEEEAALITGSEGVEEAALAELGPPVIAVTAGGDGSHIIAGGKVTRLPAVPVEVCYDIGAGDTYHAGLVAALLRGHDAVTAGRYASLAAALRISRAADMECLPTWQELEALTNKE